MVSRPLSLTIQDIDMLRGEFIGLNGGADFYASDIKGLRKEGATSLKVFLKACEQRGLEPRKKFSASSMCAYHRNFTSRR